jgi:hypothetical protein
MVREQSQCPVATSEGPRARGDLPLVVFCRLEEAWSKNRKTPSTLADGWRFFVASSVFTEEGN